MSALVCCSVSEHCFSKCTGKCFKPDFISTGCISSCSRAHTKSLNEINTTFTISCIAVMPFAISLSVCQNQYCQENSVLSKPGAVCFHCSVSKQVKSLAAGGLWEGFQ